MSVQRLTPLKVEYGGEIHRIRVDLNLFKFSELQSVFNETFSLQSGSFSVKYRDNEGDLIKVTSEEEFQEACRVFVAFASEEQSIRFTAVSVPMLKFQEATEPLMKALAALLESLDAVKAKVEKEDWVGQCKRGLSITGEAISQAADDIRESFIFCKERIEEYELKGRINEAVNELGIATQQLMENVQSSMKAREKEVQVDDEDITDDGVKCDVVGNKEEKVTVTPEVTENTEENNQQVVENVVEEEAPRTEETETEHADEVLSSTDSSESEWDVVSSEESPYASELQIIREIFPNVETSTVICLLERYNRNIYITLNALAEL